MKPNSAPKLIAKLMFMLLIAAPLLWAFDALVFMKLWAWFISPFFDVRNLLFWEAMGIGITVAWLTHQHDSIKSEHLDSNRERIAGRIVGNLIVLGFGKIIFLLLQ